MPDAEVFGGLFLSLVIHICLRVRLVAIVAPYFVAYLFLLS